MCDIDAVSIVAAVTRAARNALALTPLGSGVGAPEPIPSDVLHVEPHLTLRRYHHAAPADAPAVLLVPPLAAPASCFDLRPGQSVVEFLGSTGRAPYLVDYGPVGYADRRMGLEDWIDRILPESVLRTSAERGGEPVDLVCWSLGGTLALLTAAAHPELPIRSVTAVGSPLDYGRMLGVPQLRLLAAPTGGQLTSAAIRAAGGVPAPLTRLSYRLSAWDRELTRPFFVASNLANTEALAKMQTIDRFLADMAGYPGRFMDQVWRRFVLAGDLESGVLRLGARRIALADVTAAVLLIGGPRDAITAAGAVRSGLRTLTGARSVRYETAPGSHLGILTGPDASATTWSHLDGFLAEQVAVPGGVVPVG
ncbi:alpha/beta hydrolase [Nocardia sp. NPDC050697]|uniref:alpha/beta hydrolase n=1 Tax=Nocardia sp. NPDC050697 TaxID=3155158 RepID=UPI0033FBFCF8